MALKAVARRPGTPYNITSTSIPLVVCSSGTMGNNGAMSAITAVTTAYPSAYVYLPASAISAGSAAGWYYAVFSSTTAATIYNNTYTPGTPPTIPTSPTAFVTTGPGAFTANNSAGITCISFTLPGNAIGRSGRIIFTASTTQTNNANTKNLYFRVTNDNSVTLSLLSVAFLNCTGIVANRGAMNQQVCWAHGNGTASYSIAARMESYDLTASQPCNVMLLGQTATDTLVLESICVDVQP